MTKRMLDEVDERDGDNAPQTQNSKFKEELKALEEKAKLEIDDYRKLFAPSEEADKCDAVGKGKSSKDKNSKGRAQGSFSASPCGGKEDSKGGGKQGKGKQGQKGKGGDYGGGNTACAERSPPKTKDTCESCFPQMETIKML